MKKLIKKNALIGLPVVAVTMLSSLLSNVAAEEKSDEGDSAVVALADVKWTPLNKARGDASPQAATLWGDRAGDAATGFLVKFKDGFSSPPHIHNVTYRGVVISGLIHNDDPAAAKMWMPSSSYWTQPAGENHITAAKGENNMALIEIDSGPYLVLPSDKATDNGERPINVHESNIVWQDATETTRIEVGASQKSPQMALLWMKADQARTNGSLLKLPAGFQGELRTGKGRFRAVVVNGQVAMQQDEKSSKLVAGSYFTHLGATVYRLKTEKETVLYLRHAGGYRVVAK
ncbi:DUF4437 domain-containing protein [Verrucomicrobiaceae bacterium 5K15]|uniref:DUF4437 domain-containing protein n=1 Tax=Oceaniferula flava TaxID=2800421 RepID=A0AAE2SD72_9BACT|nr:DUF4437 domain-containing protein [Oceaniferula flavus]MBK1856066.1 DUF4437 domain-containing protein [Oceaniferula flavus]MBM1137373.1 DUF4437 domain-containing protein [Oceaniferula flavus]